MFSGETFKSKKIYYTPIDNYAVFEGDIVLGKLDEIRGTPFLANQERDKIIKGIIITGNQFRWPGEIIPFNLPQNFVNRNFVLNAINDWETNYTH